MPNYQAPIRDMQFVLHELWPLDIAYAEIADFAPYDRDTVDAILAEAAKFTENELAPLNQVGDQQGCQFSESKVSTAAGFKEAYAHFVSGGWPGLASDPLYGGQGAPHAVSFCLDEMLCAANVSFHLYPNLTQGVVRAVQVHASDELKQQYLPNMVSGQWTGAMCLTESHCGTDLGLLRTKAEPCEDGSYAITGTKIFITAGEHDLSENIIHLILARTPDAPAGVKGISLFLAPKKLINDDGSLGELNGISCGAIEHKMGIKGSATCVMNYDEAKGYLVGNLHQGMRAMFTVMNVERLAIGIQGLGLAEVAYQNALAYAKDRLQGRAQGERELADKPADPLIVHADIRRMLLQVKSFTEGARALAGWVYQQVDIAAHHPDEQSREQAQTLVDLFTPVVKAFFSDQGFIQCNQALQVLGGHGYISEWGLEQFVRDARIAQIYEGANGIQALDLVGRKLLADDGAGLALFIDEVNTFLDAQQSEQTFNVWAEVIAYAIDQLQHISQWLLQQQEPQNVHAAATEYLELFGLVALAYAWGRSVQVALLHQNGEDAEFYQAKIHTAQFYMQRVLPKIDSLIDIIKAGAEPVMALPVDSF